MESFATSVLSNFLAGLLVVVVTGLLTYIYRSIFNSQPQQQLEDFSGASVASTIDQLIERQSRVLRRPPSPAYPQTVEYRTTIEYRSSDTSSTDDYLWIILGTIFVVLVIADYIWVTYQLPMLYIILAGTGIGVGTSVYLIVQLFQLSPPLQIEDYILSWGGLVVWLLSASIAWVAVYYPLYTEPTGNWSDVNLWTIHAAQLVGMFLLFISIIAISLVQFFTGRIYQKALQSTPPDRFEIIIWEWRFLVFIGIVIFLIIAFLLGTGIVF